ncbi:MAG: hypothetical protein R2857_15840 [Vampirovibrionales bacterium]
MSSNFGINLIMAQLSQILRGSVNLGLDRSENQPFNPLNNTLVNRGGSLVPANSLLNQAANLAGQVPLSNQAFVEQRVSLAKLLQQDGLLMNNQQTAEFMKVALDLPKDLQQLLMQLASESGGKTQQQQVKEMLRTLLENQGDLKLSTEDVAQLLDGNSKEAASKLVKMLQNNRALQLSNGHQIMEVAHRLGQIGEAALQSPQRAAETLILLYLPWSPLPPGQKMQLEFEGGEDEEEGGQEAAICVVLYLDTNVMGKFKAVIQQAEALQLHITLKHDPEAEPYLEAIEERVNEGLAMDGLPPIFFDPQPFKQAKAASTTSAASSATQQRPDLFQDDMPVGAAGFKGATRSADKQQVSMERGERVSVLVVNAGYLLARTIFDIDQRLRPLHAR